VSDLESEGFEEKYRVVIEWGRPLMNRSEPVTHNGDAEVNPDDVPF
jgi:hypothetical protein